MGRALCGLLNRCPKIHYYGTYLGGMAMKKYVSILLAVLMLASLVAVPVSATTASDVEPCTAYLRCDCGGSIAIYSRTTNETVRITCGASSSPHNHTNTYTIQSGTCPDCGQQYYNKVLSRTVCSLG